MPWFLQLLDYIRQRVASAGVGSSPNPRREAHASPEDGSLRIPEEVARESAMMSPTIPI